MNQIIQKMALAMLVVTLATACQKEEISRIQPDDQITQRTLTFDLDELQSIYTALLTQVNTLISEGVLNGPNGNGLIPQLNNLLRAINRGEAGEANRILEEDILTHLAGLLEDQVLSTEQYNTLYSIATNQTGPTTGTVTLGGVTYNWKVMADGKKWLVQNLRYEVPDSWVYPENEYPPEIPYNPDLFGRLYTRDAAFAACSALGSGWHLPSMEEWQALGTAYSDTWVEGVVWSGDPGYFNSVAYDYLVADLYGWNETGPGAGFDALIGGFYNFDPLLEIPIFGSMGQRGDYASSTPYTASSGEGKFWSASFCFFSSSTYTLIFPVPVYIGNSCRCVHD